MARFFLTICTILFGLLCMVPSGATLADTDSSSQAPRILDSSPSKAEPVIIHVGLYLLRLDHLDLKDGSATLTYYIWSRWKGNIEGSKLELMNGTVNSTLSEYSYEENGEKYFYSRCQASIAVKVDFHNYPFDEHELSLDFEHAELGTDEAILEVDRESMKYLKSPAYSGWDISPPHYSVTRTHYLTNWGMPGLSSEHHQESSHFRVSLRLHHEVAATFTKTFLLLFISISIAYLAFFFPPQEVEARIGTGAAGIFGAVTSHSVATDNLPEIAYSTLSDTIHISGVLFIFLGLLCSCLVGYLAREERERLARRLDRTFGIVLLLIYPLTVALLILSR